MRRLENKVAVVYGDGSIGSAMARSFACEGAKVFLAGRTMNKLRAVSEEILTIGGFIETAEVDALNEKKVDEHLNDVIAKAGRIDISFNAVGLTRGGAHDIPLIELSLEDFFRPVTIYTQSHFITARSAARQMVSQGSGVILMHTPNASHISPPYLGGLIPAWAAIEALGRSLSVECGPKGVRTVCLLTTSIPETPLINDVWHHRARSRGITFEQIQATVENMTHRKRLTTLKELTDAAVFVASDEGSAITGTIFNLTAGMIVN